MTTPFDPNATDFGTDVYLQDDLAQVWGLASDELNYALACGRRITQREGSFDFYDEKCLCFDIRGYLNSKLDKVRVSQLQGKIAAALLSDPRTFRSKASVTRDSKTQALLISVDNDTADGPFALVLRANGVTVDLLSVNGVTLPAPIPVTAGGAADAVGGIIIISGGNTPGPPGPPGTSSPSRSFGLQAIEDDSGAETGQIQTQLEINWALLGASLLVEVRGMGMSDAGNGIFKLRIGGSDGAIDGTTVVTLTATSPSYTPLGASETITNPGGVSRSIMTVTASAATKAARLRDISLVIQSL